MAKNRRTFQKAQREIEKKRKAQDKRDDKRVKKDEPSTATLNNRHPYDDLPGVDEPHVK